jgi:hypothetical protein
MLEQGNARKHQAIRLVLTSSDALDVRKDKPHPNDLVFRHEHRNVILVSREVAQVLQNHLLDLDEEGGLCLRPNA